MSQNTQNPYFYTLDASIPDVLEVVGATSLSIFAESDTCEVTNGDTGQLINIPLGTTLDLNPDSGNTLATLRISPLSGFAYVVMIGGTAQLI
tara:strand:+ start:1466 stop:1741 length:276 start_codon:yes stop_codon:yes gene_type:complete